MSDFMPQFVALIVAAITYGTPLLFGTLGEILTEKSGNLNLGVEGIMFMGGAVGLGGVFYYEKVAANPSPVLAVLIGKYAKGRADELSQYITHLTGTEIEIGFDEDNVVNIDGEALYAKRVRIRLVPGAANLIVPKGMKFFNA